MSQNNCTRCGKCCMNMRQYISAENRVPGGKMTCTCSLSRESFTVTVPAEILPRMYDRNFSFRYPKACPFLTEEKEGIFTCLMYESRPDHCRKFLCTNLKVEAEQKD